MKHVTSVVRLEVLVNGQVTITIRCCADPKTDYNHTVAAAVFADPTKREASLEAAHRLCAESHAALLAGQAALLEVVGQEKEHEA